MQPSEILHAVEASLADMKAGNIVSLDVKPLTSITDYMVIATGTSSRHVQAIADKLVEHLKPLIQRPVHLDADMDREWVLVDLGDVIVHIMQPRTRDFYQLETLWNGQKH